MPCAGQMEVGGCVGMLELKASKVVAVSNYAKLGPSLSS